MTLSSSPTAPKTLPPEVLKFWPPRSDAAHVCLGFAWRQGGRGGETVYELPELRTSIQIMLRDDYWLRDRHEGAPRRPVPRMALWGPRLTWAYGFAREVIDAFGMALSPSAVFALTGRPVGDFVDRTVALSSLCPDVASELERIVSVGTPDDWRRASENLLIRSAGALVPNGVDAPASALIADSVRAVGLASKAAGVGDRHYRRVFRAQHGLSPRQYRRVLRIDRMLRRLHPQPWESDPYEADPEFADQAHMIREFKALTGVTPGQYLQRKRSDGDATIRSVRAPDVAPPDLSQIEKPERSPGS
jgi:AraC-like DNA-binding protein